MEGADAGSDALIAAVKAEGRRHRAGVSGPAGTAQFALADYGPHLPHDLAHYVVERALGLQFGFWGLVVAGAELGSVRGFAARHPRRLGPGADPLLTAHAA